MVTIPPMKLRGVPLITMSIEVILMSATTLGLSIAVADARPFCYETGPGFQKCLDSPTGDYFNPIYAGPKIPESYVPWVPDTAPSPINIPPGPSYIPPAPVATVPDTRVLETLVQNDMQSFFDNPANGKTQYALHFERVLLTKTGDTTYAGTVAASTSGGPERIVPVHVTVDGDNLAWNLDPGVLVPLFQ